ncbi:MAG: hypothetical protein DRO67_08360 [Candidatus Asgardarchaeum californiense]|nr:MAG: hypothetical protein DRO67_08360 [Candidatus Asgardarchaeum californiense]
MTDMGQPGGNQLFDLGWLIGVIDSDGSYILSKQYHHKNKVLYFFPSIEITNDSEDLISNCDRIIKKLFKVGPYIDIKKPRKNGKIGYKISLRGMKRLYKALPIIVEHEIAKKEQSTLLLEYVSNRMTVHRGTPVSDRDIEIAVSLRELNASKDKITKDIPKRLK